jgi:hypothetical protein
VTLQQDLESKREKNLNFGAFTADSNGVIVHKDKAVGPALEVHCVLHSRALYAVHVHPPVDSHTVPEHKRRGALVFESSRQCCGSMTFLWIRIRIRIRISILLFSSLTFKMPTKN